MDLKQFIAPFDFSAIPVEKIRESFSHDWRQFYKHELFTFTLFHFVGPDNTHIVFNYETMISHAGTNKDEALKAFVIAFNGMVNHHLLNQAGPLETSKKEGGLESFRDALKKNGWDFPTGQPVKPITFDKFLSKVPEFKAQVLDLYRVEKIDFACEFPVG